MSEQEKLAKELAAHMEEAGLILTKGQKRIATIIIMAVLAGGGGGLFMALSDRAGLVTDTNLSVKLYDQDTGALKPLIDKTIVPMKAQLDANTHNLAKVHEQHIKWTERDKSIDGQLTRIVKLFEKQEGMIEDLEEKREADNREQRIVNSKIMETLLVIKRNGGD